MQLRIVGLMLLLMAASCRPTVRPAADPAGDLYYDGYTAMKDADDLLSRGSKEKGLDEMKKAETIIADVQRRYPSWNPEVVAYRLKILHQRVAELEIPVHASPPRSQPAPP